MKTNSFLKKLAWGLVIFIGLSKVVLAQKIQVSGNGYACRGQFGITRGNRSH